VWEDNVKTDVLETGKAAAKIPIEWVIARSSGRPFFP
jgi:hypothetical protein